MEAHMEFDSIDRAKSGWMLRGRMFLVEGCLSSRTSHILLDLHRHEQFEQCFVSVRGGSLRFVQRSVEQEGLA